MKKSKDSRRTRRHPLRTVIILLVLAFAGVIFAKLLFDSSPAKNSTDSSTDNSTAFSTEPVENRPTPNLTKSEEYPKEKEIEKYEGENPNTLLSLTGSITTARVSGENLIIRVSIDQYLSSGTCSLSLKSENNSFETTVPIFNDASTSTCEGFDIPKSSLMPGIYSIDINLTSGEKSGTISGEVSL